MRANGPTCLVWVPIGVPALTGATPETRDGIEVNRLAVSRKRGREQNSGRVHSAKRGGVRSLARTGGGYPKAHGSSLARLSTGHLSADVEDNNGSDK